MIRPQPRVEQLERLYAPKVGRRAKLRLDINENLAGWPVAVVRDLLSGITPGDLAAYPETHALYEGLALLHGLTLGHVLVTAGSELAIRYAFETLLGPGTELLILDPSFAMFEVYGRLYGADVAKVSFGPSLQVSIDELLARLTQKTRVVAIANPNNPTGTVFSEAALVTLIERAAAVGSVVLIDEAYFYFHPETIAPRVKACDNLLVTRTFSKAFGLAGVRLGYALGAPALIEAIQKVQPIDHVSVFAARLGEYAIAHEALAWDYAREVAAGKQFLIAALQALAVPVVDTHANFVLADLGSARAAIVGALHEQVLIGATVRLPFPNTYVKITVGPVPEMARLLDLLRPIVDREGRTPVRS